MLDTQVWSYGGDAFENLLQLPLLPVFTTRRPLARTGPDRSERKKGRIFLRQLNVAVTFKMTLFTPTLSSFEEAL